MNKKWLYGDSWERFPIHSNEVWIEQNTNSKLSVYDIFDGLPKYMYESDMIYSDTPWNLGNITSFYTKAGLQKRCFSFDKFAKIVFNHIKAIKPKTCYLEIGKQNINMFKSLMESQFPIVQVWNIVYYKKNPCMLIRGGSSVQKFNFTGIDDEDTPFHAMENENFNCVADFCMGLGATAFAAYKHKKRFVGTELNKRRLAVTIDRVNKLGGNWNFHMENP